MMRKLDIISTVVVLFMGVGHTVFTPIFVPGWTVAAAWFLGSGLALILLGLLNAARLWASGSDKFMLRLCLVANAAMLAWIGFVISVLPVHQAFIVTVAILGVIVGSLSFRRPVATTG